MNELRKLVQVTVLGTSSLKHSTIEYFTKSGFKQVDTQNITVVRFQRGSLTTNMYAFNPLKWKSDIVVEIEGQELKAAFSINTEGQIPTNRDEELWDEFADNYVRFLQDPRFDFMTANASALKRTKSKNWNYLGWMLLGGLMGGIPGAFIAYLTGIKTIFSVGAVLGAVALLKKKMNDDKRKQAR